MRNEQYLCICTTHLIKLDRLEYFLFKNLTYSLRLIYPFFTQISLCFAILELNPTGSPPPGAIECLIKMTLSPFERSCQIISEALVEENNKESWYKNEKKIKGSMFAFHGGLNDSLTNLWYLGLFTIIPLVIYLFGCIQKLNSVWTTSTSFWLKN